jgi:hypothetical protein
VPSAFVIGKPRDRGSRGSRKPLVASGRAEAVDLADRASFALARPGLAHVLYIAVARARAIAGASASRADFAGPATSPIDNRGVKEYAIICESKGWLPHARVTAISGAIAALSLRLGAVWCAQMREVWSRCSPT